MKITRDGYQLDHTAKARRIAIRRKEQAKKVFRGRYKIRGGIKGTNSGLKRKTGLGRLRVRGQPAFSYDLFQDCRLEYYAGIGVRKDARNCVRKGQYGRILVQFHVFEDNNSGRKSLSLCERAIFITSPGI